MGFSVGNTGYVALGSKDSQLSNCWAYSPTDDNWYQKTDFGGASRISAVAFGLGDYGYVALGSNGSTRYDDLWILEPNADVD